MKLIKTSSYVAITGLTKHILIAKNPFWVIIKFVRVKMKPGYYRLYIGYWELEVRI